MALIRCLLLASLGSQLVYANNATTESTSSTAPSSLPGLPHSLEPLVAQLESTANSLEAASSIAPSTDTATVDKTSSTTPQSPSPASNSPSPNASPSASSQSPIATPSSLESLIPGSPHEAPVQPPRPPTTSPTSEAESSKPIAEPVPAQPTSAQSIANTTNSPEGTPSPTAPTHQDVPSPSLSENAPTAAQVTSDPVVTVGRNQLLPNLLSHFAALFAKTEQTAENLEVPGPASTAEPVIDSIVSQVLSPFAPVTASSGNAQAGNPAAFAPVIGGSGSQPTSVPSMGGIIASVMDSIPASPGAQGGAIAQQTQSPMPPGQLANVALPSGSSNVNNQNTAQQQNNNKITQAWIIGTQTILPGAPAQVISGTTYSLASDSASIFVNNVAHNVYSGTNGNSDNVPYVLPGSNTVQPGGSAITVSGTTYSLSPHGSTLYINGIATILPPSPTNPPFVVDGHTISPGSQATVIDGQTYSVAAATAGGALYVNGTKIAEPQNFALLTEAMAALESVEASSTTASPSSSFNGMLTLASSTASGSGPSPTNTSHSGAVRLVTKTDGFVAIVAAVLLGGGMLLGSLL